MKSTFLIYCTLLSLVGIPAISASATQEQTQVSSVYGIKNSFKNSIKDKSQTRGVVNFEVELLKLTNLERQKVGLAPLKMSSQLARAAQLHSTDMANNNYFSHTGRNGSSMVARAKATGYKYSFLGENITAGRATPEGAVRQWMNSPKHRAAILNRDFTEIGFGYANAPNSSYRHYWVQVFGTPQR